MTTRNFRVNTGLSCGDITMSASANTITGGATGAPSSDGDFANKKYVDDSVSSLSSTTITEGNSNVDVDDGAGGAGKIVCTVDGNAEMTITDVGVRVHGDLTVDGTNTVINTSTLSVEDNIIEVNRNISANSGMPSYSGLKVNRGGPSSATEEDLWWVWDEGFDDDGTTIYGNAGGAFTTLRASGGVDNTVGTPTRTETTLVDIRANVVHARATSASYADVAERFEADAPMAEGAVVELGGSAEITEATTDLSDNVFGVISTQPAYAMNAAAGNSESHPFVAMTGRTPVRVSGAITKGQRLVSSSVKGTARAVATGDSFSPFHVELKAVFGSPFFLGV